MKITKSINHNSLAVSLCLGGLAFCIYTCMYAIRKPFTALLYHQELFGYGIKSWMVLSQLLGYTLSKFYGIRILGELKPKNRLKTMIGLLLFALLPLIFVALTPYQFWPIWMFINGFPLGLIWGIVFSYVEGRNMTELIGAMLACTFIFSSGLVKSIAIYFESIQIQAQAIPALIAIIFYIPALIFCFFLNKMPPPSEIEKQNNVNRKPLTQLERKLILNKYAGFLASIIATYVILTLIRDIRDNFGAEILDHLHIYNAKTIAKTETIITLIMLCCIPFLSTIRKHINAIQSTIFATFLGGTVCISTYILYSMNYINGIHLILFSGCGIYFGYILINISLMDRLIALNGVPANSGFLIYLADSIGYLSTFGLSALALFSRKGELPWLDWYQKLLLFGGILIVLLSILSYINIKLQYKNSKYE